MNQSTLKAQFNKLCGLFLWVISMNTLSASDEAKPAIVLIAADWGMQESLHNTIEPKLPPSAVLALHFMGKKTVATGQRAILIQTPTMQEFQQAESFAKSTPEAVLQRIQGIWVEIYHGDTPYPTSWPLKPYLVLSQPPLHPNPPTAGDDIITGQFWITPDLPTSERQKIYNKAVEYATKAGASILSITFPTQEAWDDFQKWMESVKGNVRWVSLQEYTLQTKGKPKKDASP